MKLQVFLAFYSRATTALAPDVIICLLTGLTISSIIFGRSSSG
jgi:hypothetical protein